MDRAENKKLKKYYKEIECALICENCEKRSFMKKIKSGVDEFISQNPSAVFDDIEREFGDASTVASSLHTDGGTIKLNKNAKLMKVLFVIGGLTFLIVVVFLICALVSAMEPINIVEEIKIILK